MLANGSTALFVRKLLDCCGSAFDHVWLGSDGSDAVEAAVKLARRCTGKSRVLAAGGAFHGKTLGALALTASPKFRLGLEAGLTNVTHIPIDDFDAVAREVASGDVAALILEPIQGEVGVRPLNPEIVAAWVRDLHRAGGFFVSDEIQTGLGRCGPFSVAVANGWKPDAVLFGKALGGGVMPLSALVSSSQLFEPLAKDPTWHTATFGGHPLGCAAGLATLETLPTFRESALKVGESVSRALAKLTCRYSDLVTELRGFGLMWAVEFRTADSAGSMLVELAQHGLLVSPCLSSPSTIRLLPPMVVSPAEMKRALDALDAAFEITADHQA
jgi:putrescine aminotransferase